MKVTFRKSHLESHKQFHMICNRLRKNSVYARVYTLLIYIFIVKHVYMAIPRTEYITTDRACILDTFSCLDAHACAQKIRKMTLLFIFLKPWKRPFIRDFSPK